MKLIRLIALSSILGFWSLPASAACAVWNVSGRWTVMQSNGAIVYLNLVQIGYALTGQAGRSFFEAADVDGTIVGNRIQFTVYWEPRSVGVYSGTIGENGRIEGKGYDRVTPSSTATWYSAQRLPCFRER